MISAPTENRRERKGAAVEILACAKLNLTLDVLGKRPDGYHDLRMIMQSVELADVLNLEYNGTVLPVALTDVIKGSSMLEDGTIVDSRGLEIDPKKIRVKISIKPQDIELTDDQEEGLVQGSISNMIYKGDHYSYVIHTDLEQDFVVNDEYLWNMEDQVGLVMPVEKMIFTVKK